MSELERPRRAKGESIEQWSARLEAYVAQHRRIRNARHIITERIERVIEHVPVQDAALHSRMDQAEEMLAYLAEPVAPDPETPPLGYEDEAPQQLPPNPAEAKLSDYVPQEIRALMNENETFTQARKRLSELLNVELAELKNLRGMAGEDLDREADVERLLGLFARLGEI